jgi:hypothetical protein
MLSSREAALAAVEQNGDALYRASKAARLRNQPPSITLESGRKAFRHPESRKQREKTILKTPPPER